MVLLSSFFPPPFRSRPGCRRNSWTSLLYPHTAERKDVLGSVLGVNPYGQPDSKSPLFWRLPKTENVHSNNSYWTPPVMKKVILVSFFQMDAVEDTNRHFSPFLLHRHCWKGEAEKPENFPIRTQNQQYCWSKCPVSSNVHSGDLTQRPTSAWKLNPFPAILAEHHKTALSIVTNQNHPRKCVVRWIRGKPGKVRCVAASVH